MKQLPQTDNALSLRTDFSDDAAWESICKAIGEPGAGGFQAYVDCIASARTVGLNDCRALALAPANENAR